MTTPVDLTCSDQPIATRPRLRRSLIATAGLALALGATLVPAVASAQGAAPSGGGAESEGKAKTARQRSWLAADPRAAGEEAVIPIDDNKIRNAEDWTPEIHGFMRAPMALSVGSRDNPASGQSGTTFHTPPLVPDAQWGSWLLNQNLPGAWANFYFTYGNRYAAGTVGIGAYDFSTTQVAGSIAKETLSATNSVVFGPVFVSLYAPDLLDGKARAELNVGSFTARYGLAGRYDWGKYLTFSVGAAATIGYLAAAEYDLDDWTFRIEQALGTNNFPNIATETGPSGTTLLLHEHAMVGWKDRFRAGLHAFHAMAQDDRVNPPGLTGTPDGKMQLFGADARYDGGVFGGWYVGGNIIGADHVATVAPVLQTVNVNGGAGMIDNWLGQQSSGNGTVANVLWQFDYNLANAFWYPDEYDFKHPDVAISLFGLYTNVTAGDPPQGGKNPWNGISKLKLGTEVMYSPVAQFSFGARADTTMNNLDDSSQNFSSISPKVWITSNWLESTHEKIIIQYSHYFYGDKQPMLPSVFNNVTGDALPTGRQGTHMYDQDVLYIAAEMYF